MPHPTRAALWIVELSPCPTVCRVLPPLISPVTCPLLSSHTLTSPSSPYSRHSLLSPPFPKSQRAQPHSPTLALHITYEPSFIVPPCQCWEGAWQWPLNCGSASQLLPFLVVRIWEALHLYRFCLVSEERMVTVQPLGRGFPGVGTGTVSRPLVWTAPGPWQAEEGVCMLWDHVVYCSNQHRLE